MKSVNRHCADCKKDLGPMEYEDNEDPNDWVTICKECHERFELALGSLKRTLEGVLLEAR